MKREFIITMKDFNTGEVKDVLDGYEQKEDQIDEELEALVEFIWDDGNYGCDCNRYIFFYDDRETHHPCGHERFEVLRIRNKKNDQDIPFSCDRRWHREKNKELGEGYNANS